jgi:hypothetical protein
MTGPSGKSTARGDSTRPREDAPPVLALQWISPEAKTSTRLIAGTLVFGREGADVTLDGEQVSRRHAEIRRVSSSWKLYDLESTNGCFVNGERISEQALRLGDLVRIGDWLAMVTLVDADGSGEPEFGLLAPGILGGVVMASALRPALRAAKSDLPLIVEVTSSASAKATSWR